jgi:hypothetical protein
VGEGVRYTFAIPLRAGEVVGHKLDVLIAGDDEDGRARSPQSPATAGSTRSTWARCSARARGRGLLHIGVQNELGTGFERALTIVA